MEKLKELLLHLRSIGIHNGEPGEFQVALKPALRPIPKSKEVEVVVVLEIDETADHHCVYYDTTTENINDLFEKALKNIDENLEKWHYKIPRKAM